MKTTRKQSSKGLTRRDVLKASGVVVGGLALGGAVLGSGAGKAAACVTNECGYPVDPDSTHEYTYPTDYNLGSFTPNTPLDDDEMRITFLGTDFPPARRAQQMMSIFVEVGPWVPDPNGGPGKAKDSFVLDCGAGTLTNYSAMGISPGRMDKIFISHLHADHMSDLSAIYCFGPSQDRKWPLYVWGHGPSGVKSPKPPHQVYDDGTKAFCKHLRKAMRWHTESFSFMQTDFPDYQIPTRQTWGTPFDLVPVSDDKPYAGFGLVPIELNWKKVGGIAYNNPSTRVKITHFPVIHCRKGSMGYKIEWTDPNGQVLSMIYTSDTRPETNCIEQANNVDPATGKAQGVDVFIHEMILPPELMAMKNFPALTSPPPPGQNPVFDHAVSVASDVEQSSHTPQGAYGYVLSQINPRPRLAVIAHFPATNDTVGCALNSVKAHFSSEDYPVLGKDIIWATDLMVLRVKKSGITQLMGKVSDYTFSPPSNQSSPLAAPKYPTPIYQLDQSTLIPPQNADGSVNYCDNGY